jgi:ABC-2 type transport system ATP-binding protein
LGYLVESASLKELYSRLSRQQIILSTLGDLEQLKLELQKNSLVEEWELLPQPGSLKVYFSGNANDSAELLRNLIQANLPISQFNCTNEDLETIFLKLGHKQVS